MAFPQVVGITTTEDGNQVNDLVVNYPASPVTGNLLFCLVRHATSSAATWPGGWNELFGGVLTDWVSFAWRKVDGTEGATFTVSQSSAARGVAVLYEISGAEDPDVQVPEFSTEVIGTSTQPNPGELTPTGGAKDYLWLWWGSWQGEATSPPSGNPTDYSTPTGASTGTAGGTASNCRIGTAERELNASSEDPGAWTIDDSDDWAAFTIAIHPGVAAAAEIADPPRFIIQGSTVTV